MSATITRIAPWTYPYDEAELDRAAREWGCNCGPGALAAILGLKPDQVRDHVPYFDARRYTNPSMMKAALDSLNVVIRPASNAVRLTTYGLCRIQWEGPWCDPGVPPMVAYRKTHWIGALDDCGEQLVFDVNGGWDTLAQWERETVPELTALYKGASGGWHATHRWELDLSV